MDCSMPGFPVHQQLPESAPTYVRWVGDAIQKSHPLSSPSPPAFNHSQNQGLFKWVSSSHQAAKVVLASVSVLPMNVHDWFPSEWTGRISLSKGLSRVFSNTTVRKHQFFCAQLSSQPNSHNHTWPLEKIIALTRWTFVGKIMSLLLNMLSRLVITFLPRSKRLSISWLQSLSAVIFGAPE